MIAADQTIKVIAIYARVSTARQEEEQTIKTQLAAIKDFAGKNGYTIVKEYIDDGWSGDMLARPALDQLRADAKKKLWQAALFYDPDRLARRYSYQELVMDELHDLGIESLFVTIPPSKNSEDRLMYGVRGVFAEYERMRISERFRLGKIRKAKEGHIMLSEGGYGYTFVPKAPDRQGYLQINEREARNVQLMFHLVGGGCTLRSLVRELQKRGIAPRKSKRGVWSTSTLSTLLRRRAYIGQAHYGASYAVVPEKPLKKERYRRIKKTSRRMKPINEWIRIPVPAIVDHKVFERVQEKLKSNFDMSRRNTKNQYLLSGKIYCACGHKRLGEGSLHGKHLYYRCADRIYNLPLPPKCTERGINARVSDEMVWSGIAGLMGSPKLLRAQMAVWSGNRKRRICPKTDVDLLESEMKKLKAQVDRYTKVYAAGLIPLEKLQEYMIPIKDDISALERQIAVAHSETDGAEFVALPDMDQINSLVEKARMGLENLSFEQKKAIVQCVVDKIVGTQKQLQITGCIPLQYLTSCLIPPSPSAPRERNHTYQEYKEESVLPFEFVVQLLPPRYGRHITKRNSVGQIMNSEATATFVD